MKRKEQKLVNIHKLAMIFVFSAFYCQKRQGSDVHGQTGRLTIEKRSKISR